MKMKKILNEWRKFLNENEGEDYYIRTMEPTGEQGYVVKMSNGEEFIAEFGEDLVVKYSKSDEPAKDGIFDMVVKFIIEDLPYEWDGRAQDDDPEGFKRAMKMIDSLHHRYLDIRKKEKERDAGDAGKQMGLPNVSEIRLGANTPQELGVITDELVDRFYGGEMEQEELFDQLKDYFASVASKNEMDVDSLIDILIDKGYSSQLDGLLYDPKFREMLK